MIPEADAVGGKVHTNMDNYLPKSGFDSLS